MKLVASDRMRRILRIAAWNAALTAAGLALVAAAGEIYLRASTPPTRAEFMQSIERQFQPGVGRVFRPNSEVRITNRLDFWQTSRANRFGFLDREPLSPQDAAASCHAAVIGDSFVEAPHVSIPNKLHARLEEIAADRLPGLNITASAFGVSDTGQVNQIPYYDRFARSSRPNLIVLVFTSNDFKDNSSVLKALSPKAWDPVKSPFATAYKREDDTVALRPPDPDYENHILGPGAGGGWESVRQYLRLLGAGTNARGGWTFREAVEHRILSASRLINWAHKKYKAARPNEYDVSERARTLSERPCCENILYGWSPRKYSAREYAAMANVFGRKAPLPPVFQDALDYTAFALDEFKARADRDGAMLVILSNYTMGSREDPMFDRMSAMAQERGIPVIDQYAYIARQGHAIEDAHFQHDAHWNANGHLWAAEALMEWMERNPDVCGGE